MKADSMDLGKLKELAKAATPGPWECQIPAMTGEWPHGRVKPLKISGKLYNHPMLPIADAEYVAALNPKVALELIERIERAEAVIPKLDEEFFRKIIRNWRHVWMNQNQNDEADRKNYFNRAFGIDANMQVSLARSLVTALASYRAESTGLGAKDGG